MSGQVVNDQFGAGKRTVQAVAAVNEAGQIIGGIGAPMSTTDSLGGTRAYDWAGNSRTAVATASTAAAALPTLSASRELMAHASTRCFVRLGESDVGAASAAAGHLVLEAGERFHFRVAVGNTHFRVIRDTADGFLTLTAVV